MVPALFAALFCFAYPFVIYPLALLLLASKERAGRVFGETYPAVALVICAYNEEKIIRSKVENSLELDYPGILEIVIVSDGSSDRTAEIVREYGDRRLRLIANSERRGKTANLNDVIGSLPQEFAILSDANVIYRPDAISKLIRHFQDPEVGAVSGKVILTDTVADIRASENDYYSLEWTIQKMESGIYSMVGVDGAMYAIRTKLFVALLPDTLIDDFVIAMGIVRQGARVVFEPEALAWERGPSSLREEFRRKVRIAAGATQSLVRGNGIPWGAPFRFWFLFVSHKLLRWLSPVTAGISLATALFSWREPLSQLILFGASIIVTLFCIRFLSGWEHRLLNAPFYFVLGQLAMLRGMIKGLTGRQSVMWAKANR